MRMSSISSAGCENTMMGSHSKSGNADFMDSIFTVCTHQSKRCSPISTKLIPKRRSARGIITVVSNSSERRSKLTVTLLGFGMTPTCEEAVVKELVELRRKAMEYLQRDGQVAADAYFCAEQNALVVRNAEEYYRNMFRREVSSWNLRDTHMMESLVRLAIHLE